MNHIRPSKVERNILGMRVDDWTWNELSIVLEESIRNHKPVSIWGISVPLFAMTRQHPEIVDFTKLFDIVVADGAGIPFIGHLLGQPIRQHIGLPFIAQQMIELCSRKGYRCLLFGATREINDEAGRQLLQKFPSLNLCQGINGYYSQEQECEIAERIRDLHPDVVLVGMSFPKKEKFIINWKTSINVPICIACGGFIDVLAGKTTLAPKMIEKLSLSWLWRFIQEPRRLFHSIFMNVFLFIFYIFPITMIKRILHPSDQLNILTFFKAKETQ